MDFATGDEIYATVHALQAGHLTLPERFFVRPASKTRIRTVPSLSFLCQHVHPRSGKITRILFDLGLRHPTADYPEPLKKHLESRQPVTSNPDVVKSLELGGLTPNDIDYVIYSHVHWDHIGNPQLFRGSTFVVGPGTSTVLDGSNSILCGTHSVFEKDLLAHQRTIEIPEVTDSTVEITTGGGRPDFQQPWKPFGPLPRTMDIFQDGSILVVDAPGHLPGHINLLVRTEKGRHVYLAGDTCHDRRLLTGERQIGEWLDEHGGVCCIHSDRREAQRTMERVRQLELEGVEVILAHDLEWECDPNNQKRYFGRCVDSKFYSER